MIEIYNIAGATIIDTDVNIQELYKNWVESLYRDCRKGKKLNLSEEFQFKVLLGEFLSDEIYSHKDSPKATEEEKATIKKLSDELGMYFDKALILCLKSFDEKIPLKVRKRDIDNLNNAIDFGINCFLNPNDILKKFESKYGVKFR